MLLAHPKYFILFIAMSKSILKNTNKSHLLQNKRKTHYSNQADENKALA